MSTIATNIKNKKLKQKKSDRPQLTKGLKIFALFAIFISIMGIMMSLIVNYSQEEAIHIKNSNWNPWNKGIDHVISFNREWIKWPLYFTTQSNILIAIVLIGTNFRLWNIKNKHSNGIMNLAFINITITMIFFWALIFPHIDFQNWRMFLSTFIVHTITPIMFIVFYIWFNITKNISFRSWGYFELWIPIIYYLIWFICSISSYYGLANTQKGSYSHSQLFTDSESLYPFLNFESNSIDFSIGVIVGFAILFISINAIFIFFMRFILKRSIKKNGSFAIGGQTAAGKSTTVRKITRITNFQMVEEFDKNDEDIKNVLKEVNSGSNKHPLANEFAFLNVREITYRKNISKNIPLVFDRTFMENYIFSRVYISDKNLKKVFFYEWNERVSKLLLEVGRPNFYIFLDLNWNSFYERIHGRGRNEEIDNFSENIKIWKKLIKVYKREFKQILRSFGIKTYIVNTTGKS
ncbi:MAG: deoxynucleoside kinase, partial [Mollicutes bacterium PWAP]|nr:deoxynucleoside kinase [Mollicutes bacterium PWAP]